MDRPNYWHDTTEVCVNKLFNMIQQCRIELEIMSGRSEFKGVADPDLVKSAEALAEMAKEVFATK